MKHPSLVHFRRKYGRTMNTMQYSFSQLGCRPIRLKDPTPLTGGRRYEGHALRSMTPAERQRKRRGGLAAILVNELDPSQDRVPPFVMSPNKRLRPANFRDSLSPE